MGTISFLTVSGDDAGAISYPLDDAVPDFSDPSPCEISRDEYGPDEKDNAWIHNGPPSQLLTVMFTTDRTEPDLELGPSSICETHDDKDQSKRC